MFFIAMIFVSTLLKITFSILFFQLDFKGFFTKVIND